MRSEEWIRRRLVWELGDAMPVKRSLREGFSLIKKSWTMRQGAAMVTGTWTMGSLSRKNWVEIRVLEYGLICGVITIFVL
jgi:hypothetical protein